jgi:predicted nucleic acid-binding Zn ribbon protein
MMLTRRFEVCAYRHCTNEFRPKREAQRFCSPRCREAYRYDIKRAASGTKKARKKHLGPPYLEARKKGQKGQTKQCFIRRV